MNSLLAYETPGVEVFGFKINVYAMIIVFGIFVAFAVISLLFKRRNMSPDLFLTIFCICLPCALITTRLFYCLTDDVPIEQWFSFEGIRQGGLSIVGGILGGAISVLAVCYFKKINFFRVGDCVVVGLVLAQAIGRWANFANQEVYGMEVTNEALQFFPFSVYINKTSDGNCLQTFTLTFAKLFGTETDITGGTWHYAFFFYESIVNTIAGVLMFINAWKNPYKPNGINTACYFINYGLIRSIMEPLRDPQYILQGGVEGGIPWSLVFSLVLLFGGLALLFSVLLVNKRKEGKLFGSFKEEYGITTFIKDTKDEIAYKNKTNMMCAIYPENYVDPPKKEKKGFSLPWKKNTETQENKEQTTEQKTENEEIASEEKNK